MKLYKLIPALAIGSLMLSSCDDFLDKESKDSLTVEQYLTSKENLLSFTNQLYGPYTWNTYEAKFSWCANELTVGNVYHNYGDEGSFFFLSFDNTNANLLDGYQGLYGLISRCNMLIDEMPSIAKANGISETDINHALGEAYMFRGMAYFLLTEYWGESYIVLHNTNDIASDMCFSIPKASRACMYAQVERDWLIAASLLPTQRWGNNGERATQTSAYGMLGKLYLTMASAATTPNTEHPFVASKTNAEYYTQAINFINAALSQNSYMESSEDYENIFWPYKYSKEIIFGLNFELGPYGAGSCRQVHFARSKYLDGGDDYYGGEKGLTVSLFYSYDKSDIRKHATSYFTSEENDKNARIESDAYTLYDGSTYYYYYNPTKSFGAGKQPYGSEPEAPCLNNCRKFVYSVPLVNKFSAPLSFAFLRTADLYLMRAEATMALSGATVSQESMADLADINTVRTRAGLDPLTTGVALLKDDNLMDINVTNEGNVVGTYRGVYIPNQTDNSYSTYDLFLERRHEFALECQNWLDLKRIYYRDPDAATRFLEQEDRGYTYGVRIGSTSATNWNQYQRKKEINMIDPTQEEETDIDVSKVQWFFPLPSSIVNRGGSSSEVYSDVTSVSNGSYPY